MEVQYSPNRPVSSPSPFGNASPQQSPWAGYIPQLPTDKNTASPRNLAWGAGIGPPKAGALDPSMGGLQQQRASRLTMARPTSGNENPREGNKASIAASPYQKAAATRAAEQAIRPWAPMGNGMGERLGAPLQAPTSLSYLSPALQTSPAAAEAIGRAAERVAKPGTNQVGADDAWSPVPHAMPRQIWPSDLVLPPRYCVGCRGGHEEANERNATWEPYSPLDRLKNLNMLETKFMVALSKGFLCCRINPNGSSTEPIQWTQKDEKGEPISPLNMPTDLFIKQLTLMWHGLREGHEPYRHLATKALQAFLDTQSPYIVEAIKDLIQPLTLAFQTYEPHLVGHMLLMLQHLLKSHPGVAPALQPYLVRILPYLGLFRPKNFTLHLPPPFCLPSSGSFTGNGIACKSGKRKCGVCGCPVDKDLDAERRQQRAEMARKGNAHLLEDAIPAHQPRNPLKGRRSEKYHLASLITQTLDLIVMLGGPGTLEIVQRQIPRYSYV